MSQRTHEVGNIYVSVWAPGLGEDGEPLDNEPKTRSHALTLCDFHAERTDVAREVGNPMSTPPSRSPYCSPGQKSFAKLIELGLSQFRHSKYEGTEMRRMKGLSSRSCSPWEGAMKGKSPCCSGNMSGSLLP